MMMKIILATVLFGILAASQVKAKDYCDPTLCNDGDKHIGCNNHGYFAKDCPQNAAALDIDQDVEELFVNAHLEVRQQWASGQGDIDVKACRMPGLIWIRELAWLAKLNVKQCKIKHDQCHNTETFKYSGQNLYISGFKGGSPPSLSQIAQDAVNSWASEGQHVTAEYLASYPDNYTGPTIGHFTTVVNDRNVAFGCAVSNYETKDGYNTYLVACNYAISNFKGERVYSACSEAASECTKGTNPEYPALCSDAEDIDYNYS